MKIFRTVKEMQEFALRLKQEGRRIGLDPRWEPYMKAI